MPRRNKKQKEHVNLDRWLITYADLITLLLVFFIIMYSMSKVDKSKFDVIAQALKSQYRKSDTVLPNGNGFTGAMSTGQGEDGKLTNKDQQPEQHNNTKPNPADKEQHLQDVKKQVEAYIKENKLEAQVFVNDTPRGIAVTLNDLFLFNLGKAELKAPAYPVLQKLASLFPTLVDTKVSIEGHTDDYPISPGSPFKDNWGLSFERALSVLRYFSKTEKLPEKLFEAQAFADTKPVVPNDSDANRTKNRRVEIVLLRDVVPQQVSGG